MIFRFASPWFLALIPMAVASAWWLARRRARGDARLVLPAASRLRFGASPWMKLERLLPWMRCGALVLGIVALARPQSGAREETIATQGVDIVVVLDISGSMRCEDARPLNRLDVARRSLARFIEGRPSDRIGLVVFASLAVTRAPLTLDHEMLQRFVQDVDFASQGEDRTAIGMGLATALNRLRHSTAKSKVVVLLTDGRNNEGQLSPDAAAEAARALGVRVYAIGAGAEGEVPCPVDQGALGRRYVMVREELDESLLRRVATSTSGRYFRATDEEGLRQALATIDALEKTEVQSRVRVLYTERFPLLLVPAGVFLGLETFLAATRLRRIP